jgi:hypothetical protein
MASNPMSQFKALVMKNECPQTGTKLMKVKNFDQYMQVRRTGDVIRNGGMDGSLCDSVWGVYKLDGEGVAYTKTKVLADAICQDLSALGCTVTVRKIDERE